MLTKTVNYELKLIKHLGVADVERVRDYVARIVLEWPDLEKCPIDKALLMRAVAFVKHEYTLNEKAKTPEEVFTPKVYRSYI